MGKLKHKIDLDIKKILDNSPDIIFTIDTQGKILYANPSFSSLLGYSEDEIIGRKITDFVVDKDVYKACMLSVKTTGVCLAQDTFFRKKDGGVVHVVKNVRAVEEDGKVKYIIVNARDLSIIDELNSLLEEARRKLEESKKNLEKLVEERTKDLEFRKILLEQIKNSLPVGLIFIYKDGTDFIINEKAEKLIGTNVYEIRTLIKLFLKKLKKSSREKFKREIRKIFSSDCEGTIELELKRNRFYEITIKLVKNNTDFYGYLIILNDITHQKKIEKNLKNKLYKDQLTGLPNRTKLIEDIEKSTNPVLAIVNIDSFKEINDFYGHNVGDKVLQEFGKLLKNFCSKYNLKVYKLSGDEFAVFSDIFFPKHDFEIIVQRLITHVEKKPLYIDDYEIHLNVTVGIADNKENILTKADMALRLSKEKKISYLFFDESFNIEKTYEENIRLVKEIKDALKDNRITVYYQPIVNNKTGRVEEYECLVRLIDKDGNIVSPNKFLNVAKKSKLYPYITKEVINKSFSKFKNKPYKFAINLSVSDILDYEIVSFIIDKLSRYEGKNRVIFEILESEGIENFEEVLKFIKEVKSLGAKIAIDDFGSGYSNFEFILKLEVDYLKIDSSIIKNVDNDIYSTVIAETIVNFCKKLGIKTIAEFVHSESVYEHVKAIGIDFSQGFFIGKPTPELKD